MLSKLAGCGALRAVLNSLGHVSAAEDHEVAHHGWDRVMLEVSHHGRDSGAVFCATSTGCRDIGRLHNGQLHKPCAGNTGVEEQDSFFVLP
jgi:hypothetical protein